MLDNSKARRLVLGRPLHGSHGADDPKPMRWALERFLDPEATGQIPASVTVASAGAKNFDDSDMKAQTRPDGSWFSPVDLALQSGRLDLLAWMAPRVGPESFAPSPDELHAPMARFARKPDMEALGIVIDALGARRVTALMLTPAGPDLNTPLHALACHREENDVALALAVIDQLDLKELDVPNNRGVTPLMLAAQRQVARMCLGLMDRGADPARENDYGSSALSLAAEWAGIDDGATRSVFEAADMSLFLRSLQEVSDESRDPLRRKARL